jgi:hypothetical protein
VSVVKVHDVIGGSTSRTLSCDCIVNICRNVTVRIVTFLYLSEDEDTVSYTLPRDICARFLSSKNIRYCLILYPPVIMNEVLLFSSIVLTDGRKFVK